MEQQILEGSFWWEQVGELDIFWKFQPKNQVISTCVYGPMHGTWRLDGNTVEINFEEQGHAKKSQYVGKIQEDDNGRMDIEGYKYFFLYKDNPPSKDRWHVYRTDPKFGQDYNWD
jgi:hypothetical protein